MSAAPRNPTPKTICRKFREGWAALAAGAPIVIDPDRHVVGDLQKLGIDEDTYWSLLPRLFEAVNAAGPVKCYAGAHPAKRLDKHPGFNGLEMWAFKTSLPEFPFKIYFKFCLKEHPKSKELQYCHVNCKPDRYEN
jgi:hypothetical protein